MIPLSTELSAKPSSKAMCPREALITLHDLKNCRSSESKGEGWLVVQTMTVREGKELNSTVKFVSAF